MTQDNRLTKDSVDHMMDTIKKFGDSNDDQLKQTPSEKEADPDELKKPAYRKIGVATITALKNLVANGCTAEALDLIDEILDY